MTPFASPLQRYRADVQQRIAPERTPVSDVELDALTNYLETFTSAAALAFGISPEPSPAASQGRDKREALSEQAWALARAIEARAPFVRAVKLTSGEELQDDNVRLTLLSGAELLSELALGSPHDPETKPQGDGSEPTAPFDLSFRMLKRSVEFLAETSHELSQTIAGPILWERTELRKQAAEALREARLERREEKRAQAEEPSNERGGRGGTSIIKQALKRAGSAPEEEAKEAEFLGTSIQRWHEVARRRFSLGGLNSRTTLIASAALALTGPAVVFVGKLLGLGGEGQNWILPAVLTLQAAVFVLAWTKAGRKAAGAAWKMASSRLGFERKPKRAAFQTPTISEAPETANFGSYLSKDKSFERRMGVTAASVFIPSAGRLMPLEDWLGELPRLFPEADDLPVRADFFRGKTAPGHTPGAPLADGETEITLPLAKVEEGYPLHPSYEVRGLSFIDKRGVLIPAADTEIQEGILGSFELTHRPPSGAHSVTFRIGTRAESEMSPQLIDRIKKYLPFQPSSGTGDLVEMRQSLALLYPNDAERSEQWIAQLRSRGYYSTEDKRVSELTSNFGLLWNTAYHAHRLGNCDFHAAHAVAELLSIKTAAFRVSGITPDSSSKEFLGAGGHAQAGVLTPTGPRFYDLTIGAARRGFLDFGKLTSEERSKVESSAPPQGPDEAYERGLLLRKAITTFKPNASTSQRGHSFRDDSAVKSSPAHAKALQHAQSILNFKGMLDALASKRYEGFAEALRSYSVMWTLYAEPPEITNQKELPPELHPSAWPSARGLLKAALAAALREPSLKARERSHLLHFAARRCIVESHQIPRFMPSANPDEAFAGLVEKFKDGSIKASGPIEDLKGTPFELVTQTFPALYSSRDLLEIAPKALFEGSGDLSAASRRLYCSALLWNCFTALLPANLASASSLKIETSEFSEFPNAHSLLKVLEAARCAFGDAHTEAQDKHLPLATCVQAAMGINAAAHARFPSDPAKPETGTILSAIDESTFELLRVFGMSGNFSYGVAPLAALSAFPEISPHQAEQVALFTDYIQRQGSRFHGLASPESASVSVLPALASAVVCFNVGSRVGVEPYLEAWLSFIASAFPQSDPQRSLQDESWLKKALEGAPDFAEGFPNPKGSAGNILVSCRLSEKAAVIGAYKMLQNAGAISERALEEVPWESDEASANFIASKVDLRVAGGKPTLTAHGNSVPPGRVDAARIPWLMKALCNEESKLWMFARASYALGGFDQDGQRNFEQFAEQHPWQARTLARRLRVAYEVSDLPLDFTPLFSSGISIFDADDLDSDDPSEAPSSPSDGQVENIQSATRASLVANAFHGLDRNEVPAALQWVQGVRISFRKFGLFRLEEKASEVIEAVTNLTLARARVRSEDSTSLSETDLNDILARFELMPHPADAVVTVPLAAPLSARAKVAALLLVSTHGQEILQAKGEGFHMLSSALGVPPLLFKPLTNQGKSSGASLRTSTRLSALEPEFYESPFSRAELLEAADSGPRALGTRRGSSAVRYRFPEFSDLALRGLRTPPGGTGIYEAPRAYTPGTPAKALDHKASARTGKLLVRDRVEEVERPTILCIDIDSLAPLFWRVSDDVPPASALAQMPPIRALTRELLSLETMRRRSAVVLTSSGSPQAVFLSPNSKLKQFFVSNRETASICEFIPGFTSAEIIDRMGRFLIAACTLRGSELAVPCDRGGVSQSRLLSWVSREPRGTCLRIFDCQDSLTRGLSELATFQRRLQRVGGFIEVIPYDPYEMPKPIRGNF
jgi:hypothetical protein